MRKVIGYVNKITENSAPINDDSHLQFVLTN